MSGPHVDGSLFVVELRSEITLDAVISLGFGFIGLPAGIFVVDELRRFPSLKKITIIMSNK